MKFLFAMSLLVFAPMVHADFTIAPFPAGSVAESSTQSTIATAKSDVSQHRYGHFNFNHVAGEFAFTYGSSVNPFDMLFELNGEAFRIPFGFSSADTVRQVILKSDGVYLVQRGFRWNSETDMKDRVTATVRIADTSGKILSALEYHEDTFQAQQPTFDYDYSNNTEAFRGKLTLAPQGLPSQIGEILPSNILAYDKNKRSLDWAESGSVGDVYFIKPKFQALVARIACEGPWSNHVINMFFELNGHEFYIPFVYNHIDNWSEFRLTPSKTYEFVQGGLVNDANGNLQRVEAVFQVAAADGTVNSVLTVQQTMAPVSTPTSLWVTDTYWGY